MRRLAIILMLAAAVGACNTDDSRRSSSNTGPEKSSLPSPGGNANTGTASTEATNSANTAMASNANSNASAPAPPPQNFWESAAVGNLAEIEISRLATTKAQNAEVKKYAQMMVADHGKATAELKSLAAKKNVALPAALDAVHQSRMNELQGLAGAEFDELYVQTMVEDHEATVQLFEDQAADDSDAEAKAFASKLLPNLRRHLEMIKAIQGKMPQR